VRTGSNINGRIEGKKKMIGKVSDKITPSKANKDISIWER
jgi:hypothetical protein